MDSNDENMKDNVTEHTNMANSKEHELLLREINLLKRENDLLQRQTGNERSLNLRDVEDCLPTFGKDANNQPIEKWVQDIEENSAVFGWTDLQKLVCAKKLLRGTAKLWLNAQPTLKT